MGDIQSINVLPLLLGVVFFLHQKYISPPPSASMTEEQQQQQKIMKVIMVGMFPIIMYNAPSGLAIYFITNSTLGILEGRWIRAHIDQLDLDKKVEDMASEGRKKGRQQGAPEPHDGQVQGQDQGPEAHAQEALVTRCSREARSSPAPHPPASRPAPSSASRARARTTRSPAILRQRIDAPGAHNAALKLGSRDLACAVISFAPGRSYTGEAGAEIQLPGAPHLVDRVIASLLEIEGVRLANPGEFTARAYLSGRLTAEQAEGVMAVIAAHNDAELDASRKLLAGETGREYAQIADEIATCLALVESGIDFVEEEDVIAIPRAELIDRLRALIERINALTEGRDGREHRRAETRAVLAGPANAGKSTLFNALLGRERAVTSEDRRHHARRDRGTPRPGPGRADGHAHRHRGPRRRADRRDPPSTRARSRWPAT